MGEEGKLLFMKVRILEDQCLWQLMNESWRVLSWIVRRAVASKHRKAI